MLADLDSGVRRSCQRRVSNSDNLAKGDKKGKTHQFGKERSPA